MYLFASYLLSLTLFYVLACAFVLMAQICKGEEKPLGNPEKWTAWLHTPVALSMTLASIILLYAFINCDFQVEYVFNYSDLSLPLFYRVTAFWAGQSGSMLFWGWTVAISGLLFAVLPAYRRLSLRTRLWYWLFFFGTIAFFLLIITVWSDPFITVENAPKDGRGLNPLLQNPGMIFHPPLLFLGYGGFVVPGCLALAQAMSGMLQEPAGEPRREESWGQASRPFILIAWSLLSAGIILGAWWAYMELGWGGYWAWDPVENASLIPWLVASAYLHTAVIESRRGKLHRTNVFLMALTTISAFFATYLVRSGVVESLHAFGDGGVGTPLLIFTLGSLYLAFFIAICAPLDGAPRPSGKVTAGLCVILALILGVIIACAFMGKAQSALLFLALGLVLALLLVAGKSSHPDARPLEELSSKEGLLLIVAWLLLALSFIILVATMWPVIIDALRSISGSLPAFISAKLPSNPMGLEAEFYNRTCLPLFALFAVLLVICPYRKWKALPGASGFFQPKMFAITLGSALAVGIGLWLMGIRNPIALMAAACSIAGIIGIILQFSGNPSLLGIRSTLAAYGVHMGLLMMVLGVAFSGPYQVKHTLTLGRQESARVGSYTITLNELYEGESQIEAGGKPNYIFIEAELLIASDTGKALGKLSPQRRLYTNFENQTYAEVSTLFSLGNEIYATLMSVDDSSRASLAVHINPLVNWLWIGGTLMCLFPFIGLARVKRLREQEEELAQPQSSGQGKEPSGDRPTSGTGARA